MAGGDVATVRPELLQPADGWVTFTHYQNRSQVGPSATPTHLVGPQ